MSGFSVIGRQKLVAIRCTNQRMRSWLIRKQKNGDSLRRSSCKSVSKIMIPRRTNVSLELSSTFPTLHLIDVLSKFMISASVRHQAVVDCGLQRTFTQGLKRIGEVLHCNYRYFNISRFFIEVTRKVISKLWRKFEFIVLILLVKFHISWWLYRRHVLNDVDWLRSYLNVWK